MKKILAMLILPGFLLACNSKNESDAAVEPATENHGHDDHASGLVLNNGAKWKADSTTLVNAALLHSIVSNAAKENLDSYMQTATQLQDGLNKMVSECTMKGADHDALHLWLEPLMKKVKGLEKATSTDAAAALLTDIEKQVNLFPQYFEI